MFKVGDWVVVVDDAKRLLVGKIEEAKLEPTEDLSTIRLHIRVGQNWFDVNNYKVRLATKAEIRLALNDRIFDACNNLLFTPIDSHEYKEAFSDIDAIFAEVAKGV